MQNVNTASVDALLSSSQSIETRFTRIFWGWVTCHILIWTIVPSLILPNLPLDAIEMLYIGHEWPLGHFKHPTLPGWFAEVASILTGNSQWAIYLLSQLAVGTCFWAAWRLGREVLSPRLAILAAAILEGCCFYNFESTEFNNNLAMYPFWALAILFLYWAMHREKKRYWIAIGISLGLGMLAKYSTGILVVTMLLYMIVDPTARRWWRRSGPYLTLLSAAVVFGPNLYWALTSGFGPVEFAISRTTIETSNFWTRFYYPIEFTFSQLLVLSPILIIALPWFINRRAKRLNRAQHDPATHRFLNAMVLWPLILHLIISLVGNLHLRSMYGSQLWTFFGVWLFYNFKLSESRSAYRWMVRGIFIVAILLVLAFIFRNLIGPAWREKASRVHFSGKELAAKVHAIWGTTSDDPLPVVAGHWWPAANVGFYGPTRTTVYGGSGYDELDFGTSFSAWMTDEKMNQSGGMVVWMVFDPKGDQAVILEKQIAALKERFPRFRRLQPLELRPKTLGKVPTVKIGVGIIEPDKF